MPIETIELDDLVDELFDITQFSVRQLLLLLNHLEVATLEQITASFFEANPEEVKKYSTRARRLMLDLETMHFAQENPDGYRLTPFGSLVAQRYILKTSSPEP